VETGREKAADQVVAARALDVRSRICRNSKRVEGGQRDLARKAAKLYELPPTALLCRAAGRSGTPPMNFSDSLPFSLPGFEHVRSKAVSNPLKWCSMPWSSRTWTRAWWKPCLVLARTPI